MSSSARSSAQLTFEEIQETVRRSRNNAYLKHHRQPKQGASSTKRNSEKKLDFATINSDGEEFSSDSDGDADDPNTIFYNENPSQQELDEIQNNNNGETFEQLFGDEIGNGVCDYENESESFFKKLRANGEHVRTFYLIMDYSLGEDGATMESALLVGIGLPSDETTPADNVRVLCYWDDPYCRNDQRMYYTFHFNRSNMRPLEMADLDPNTVSPRSFANEVYFLFCREEVKPLFHEGIAEEFWSSLTCPRS